MDQKSYKLRKGTGLMGVRFVLDCIVILRIPVVKSGFFQDHILRPIPLLNSPYAKFLLTSLQKGAPLRSTVYPTSYRLESVYTLNQSRNMSTIDVSVESAKRSNLDDLKVENRRFEGRKSAIFALRLYRVEMFVFWLPHWSLFLLMN